MHAFFMTRGRKHDVEELTKFLETRTMFLPFTDKNGKEGVLPIQSMLQPIQLWSFVFPENHKNEILTSLKFDKANIERWSNPKIRALIKGLRLAMGAKKIPKFKTDKQIYLPQTSLQNISIIPIGVKYDKFSKDLNGDFHELI